MGARTIGRVEEQPSSEVVLAKHKFVQAYNAQAAVDGHAQVIVACGVTQEAADVRQFVPMLHQVAAHMGQLPTHVTADAGYFSEANLTVSEFAGIDMYVPPDRHPHGREAPTGRSRQGPLSETMRSKLQTVTGRAVYARRKTIPEPVFGQIKSGARLSSVRAARHPEGPGGVGPHLPHAQPPQAVSDPPRRPGMTRTGPAP